MQAQSSRSLDELLRDMWGHMDEMINLQSSTEIEIGFNIGRPKDTLDDLGKFSLMLADAAADACYSQAPVEILEVKSGYLLATPNLTFAKRLAGVLITRGFKLNDADVLLVNDSVVPDRKEVALPSFETN